MFEAEESEIVFKTTESPDPPSPVPRSPPASPTASADIQCEDVLDMVQKLNNELGLINRDNVEIRTVCNQLLQDNQARDQAINDLNGLVKRSLDSPSGHPPRPDAFQPHPIISQDLIDGDGNLRASDIGITWAGPDTFLHGVRVVGPATSTPHQPTIPTGHVDTISVWRWHVRSKTASETSCMPGDSRHECTFAPSTSGNQTGLPTGGTHTTVQ